MMMMMIFFVNSPKREWSSALYEDTARNEESSGKEFSCHGTSRGGVLLRTSFGTFRWHIIVKMYYQ